MNLCTSVSLLEDQFRDKVFIISINEALGFFLTSFKHKKNHVVMITKPTFIQAGSFEGVFPVC